jgi:hypothetical protein
MHLVEAMLKKAKSQFTTECASHILIYISDILQRQWKMQKERLADEFTTALNMFQEIQRKEAQKVKEQMQRVRANSGLGDPFGGLLKINCSL